MKLKSISFLMVLLWGQALSVFPQISSKVNDFRISIDNSISTFHQYDPVLFTNSNKDFIVAWKDYRLGKRAYFAQRFDSLGNKIGANFKVHSNALIVQGDNNEFLNVYKMFFNLPMGGGIEYFYGSVYDGNNNILVEDTLLGAALTPIRRNGHVI